MAAFPPRLIRLRDAPAYLGMDRNRFNREVRPLLTRVPIGVQGVAFDRLELDRWADEYIARNGRPGRTEGDSIWDVKGPPDCTEEGPSGTSTRSCEECDFARALERVTSRKPKRFWSRN